MLKYTLKRILLMIPVLIGIAIVVFSIMEIIPGDAAESTLGPTATQEELEAERERLGLNRPFAVRLVEYVGDVFLHFDFGESYITNESVGKSMLTRLPITLQMTLGALILGTTLGLLLGIVAALHQNGWLDNIAMILALIGVSMPGFWFALMLMLLFALKLEWLPSFGIGTWKHFILPWMAAAVAPMATTARQTRSSMLEVIRSDYVTMARAKGVPKNRLIFRHALPNAIMPILTVFGGSLGTCVGGNMLIESVFSIPGLGTFMVNSIGNRDYPCVGGSVLLTSCFCGIVALVVDLLYAAIDPRIKASFTKGSSKRRAKS